MRCHLLVYSTDSSSSSGTEARAEHSVQVCSVGGRDPVPSEAAPVASQNQPQQEVGIRRQAQEWGPALTPDVGFRLHARLPQLLCSIPVPQKPLFFFFFLLFKSKPSIKEDIQLMFLYSQKSYQIYNCSFCCSIVYEIYYYRMSPRSIFISRFLLPMPTLSRRVVIIFSPQLPKHILLDWDANYLKLCVAWLCSHSSSRLTS